ncbi:MAG: peptide chain release factor N(5)-glutamine methyltransferase [Defluviitaleaceae bacterium]|nr:peptide chain release factor N(5)-glutamine methyltransferase [Defluviitaleaceae bacterium]
MTIQEALRLGVDAIGRHEAQLLLSHVTGMSLEKIIFDYYTKPLDEPAKGAFFAGLERRKTKEPLQYILGKWEFMGLDIITDTRALIPRPETEIMVEEALTLIQELGRPANVLDVCTGSGCIAVAIAKLSGSNVASVTAVDISPAALALAAENATLHEVNNINLVQSDLFCGLNGQTYDVIISNPPYIPTADISSLQPEISHEPKLALDGGHDGLDIYRRLIPASVKHIAPTGALFLEIGPRDVETIMYKAGYGIVRLVKDYSGLDRVLIGRKQEV